ncbi:MAG: phage baseplate protein [Bacteroidales bacterium]
MTVETNARFVNDLNEAYPRNRDLIKEGDDHLRLLKSVLKNTFPGVDSAITASSAKLNHLDGTFTFDGDTGTINRDLVFAEKKGLDMGGSRITNCGLGKEPTDVVTIEYIQNANWPIGSIYMTADARNPKDIFGFGEWEEFARGRVIIGTGQVVDGSADTATYANGKTGGLLNTKITTENIPEHIHGMSAVKVTSAGKHKHDSGVAIRAVNQQPFGVAKERGELYSYEHHKYGENVGSPFTDETGDHTHKLEGSTDTAGSGTPVNNVQPWIACNIWQRTK